MPYKVFIVHQCYHFKNMTALPRLELKNYLGSRLIGTHSSSFISKTNTYCILSLYVFSYTLGIFSQNVCLGLRNKDTYTFIIHM